MNIVYASDNNFVEPLVVSLASLFENNRDSDIKVFIISQGISLQNREKMMKSAQAYEIEMIFIEMPSIHTLVGEMVDVKRFSESMFSRILTGTLLPQDITKIIYIDCDTLITGDLRSLWEYDLDGKTMGAVRDSRNYRYSKNLGIQEGRYYILSGMLVIDLDQYRRRNYENLLLQGLKKYNTLLDFPDNDIICKIMQGDICYLPLRFNLATIFSVCTSSEIEILRKPEHTYTDREIKESVDNPAIIHFDTSFLVKKRPWIEGCDHPNTISWLKYREFTEFRDEPLRKEKQTMRRRMIALLVGVIPRFLLLRLIGFIHSVVRPSLQAKRFARCDVGIEGTLDATRMV